MDDIRIVISEKKEEELFEIVKKYLKDNPKNNLNIICKETGVQRELIEKWIKEGRIEIPEKNVETTEERRKRLLQNFKVMVDEKQILKRQNNEVKKDENKKKTRGFYSRDDD